MTPAREAQIRRHLFGHVWRGKRQPPLARDEAKGFYDGLRANGEANQPAVILALQEWKERYA